MAILLAFLKKKIGNQTSIQSIRTLQIKNNKSEPSDEISGSQVFAMQIAYLQCIKTCSTRFSCKKSATQSVYCWESTSIESVSTTLKVQCKEQGVLHEDVDQAKAEC
mgnify:CR=1 FL=1